MASPLPQIDIAAAAGAHKINCRDYRFLNKNDKKIVSLIIKIYGCYKLF